jgi:Virulence-associated protein E
MNTDYSSETEQHPLPSLSSDEQSLATNTEIMGYQFGATQKMSRELFPNKSSNGGLSATIDNVGCMLGHYGVTTRYNVVKKKTEVILPYLSTDTDNGGNASVTHLISLAALNELPTSQVPQYVEALADMNQYNPVEEWIRSVPWDGMDRLPLVHDTITSKANYPIHLKRILLNKWLLSATAAALSSKGFHTRGMLTLQGAQGLGKTSWVRSLVSDSALREKVVKVDHHLDTSNKDAILGAISHWIVEVGELDSSLKKDVARLKGFLTSDHDKIRRPYAREDCEFARRTVFCATVNDPKFLVDTTGNTRFWTIDVEGIDYNHGIDMQQVFAQLAVLLSKGAQWWLTAQEESLLDEVNGAHQAVSVIREEIMDAIDTTPNANVKVSMLNASGLLKCLGHDNPSNPQAKECGSILRDLLGDPNTKGKWKVPLRFDTIESFDPSGTIEYDPFA